MHKSYSYTLWEVSESARQSACPTKAQSAWAAREVPAMGPHSRGAGPLANVARGGNSNAVSASVTATVIDLAAMDAAILDMAPDASRVPNFAPLNRGTQIVNTSNPSHYHRAIKRAAPPPKPYDWMAALGPQGNDPLGSAENKVHDGSNARYFLEKASRARDSGQLTAAQTYYRMAMDRLTPAQRKKLEELTTGDRKDSAGQAKKVADKAKKPAAASTPVAPTAAETLQPPRPSTRLPVKCRARPEVDTKKLRFQCNANCNANCKHRRMAKTDRNSRLF